VSLLNDPASQERLGVNGRRLAVQRYDWREVLRTLDQVYQGISENRR